MQQSSQELVEAAGAAGFINKPVDAQRVLALVRGVLYPLVAADDYENSWGGPTLAGAWAVHALLGLGAYINRACVFGAIARLGTGEWPYLATPLGFYVGCVSFGHVFALPAHRALAYGSPVLQAPAWVAVLRSPRCSG